MKKYFALLIIALLFWKVEACHDSDLQLDSVVTAGPNFTVYLTLNIGGGFSATRDFAIGIYTPGAVPVNIVAFTPAFIISDSTGETYTGMDVGPQGPPFSSQATLYYAPAGPGDLVIGTGPFYIQSVQISITVDVLPDSMYTFGVEGAGNPVAGCYGNPDMGVAIGLPLSVHSNELSFDCISKEIELPGDIKSNFTDLLFSSDGTTWQNQKSLNLAAESNKRLKVEKNGYYKLSGKSSSSNIVHVNCDNLKQTIKIYPNPSIGDLGIELSESCEEISIYDSKGKLVQQRFPTDRLIQFQMDPGIYFVKIHFKDRVVTKKAFVI